MNLLIIFVVLFGHWLSDFVLQKNKQKPSKDKSLRTKIVKTLKHLFPHTLYYSLILTGLVYLLYLLNIFGAQYWWTIFLFFGITFITHFLTDLFITLINSNHLKNNNRHKYFVTIGLDQLIHYTILFISIDILYF
jgi:hypothetical protein